MDRWVIIADGEGAQACVIANGDLHEAVHRFMCVCEKPWKECDCGASMVLDVGQIDDDDLWQRDEDGKKFSISWPHETGKITLYRLSEEQPVQAVAGD
jgi:hypothetical protein